MIQVQFVFQGKTYTAELSQPSGMGGTTYHVMVQKRYFGIVHKVADNPDPREQTVPGTGKYKWIFSSQNGKLQEYEKLFVDAVQQHQVPSKSYPPFSPPSALSCP